LYITHSLWIDLAISPTRLRVSEWVNKLLVGRWTHHWEAVDLTYLTRNNNGTSKVSLSRLLVSLGLFVYTLPIG
jgi:hypothetical protein